MEKSFEGGESIEDVLDDMIAHCRAHNMPLPYVIIIVPANGGVSVARATAEKGDALFKLPPAGEFAASPINVLLVDADGGTAHYELSATGSPTSAQAFGHRPGATGDGKAKAKRGGRPRGWPFSL